MTSLRRLYNRLDHFQRRGAVRIVASLLVLIVLGGFFGYVLTTSYRLDARRAALESLLTEQNLRAGDPFAASLAETGVITYRGVTYGGPFFAARTDLIFEEDGSVIAPAILADALVLHGRPAWEPDWLIDQPGTTWLLGIAGIALALLIVWGAIILQYLLTAVGTGILILICLAFDWNRQALSIAVMGNLIFGFILLTRAALLLFRSPRQVFAVAHTVIQEASRTRIALTFIVILLVLLPLLPVWMDTDAPLRFQVQWFIAWSFRITFGIVACMTLFLSCATVAFEIRDRQIWQVMTKPTGRFSYILGKWVGVMTVNLILLIIAGLSIFTFIQYLRTQPVAPGVAGQLDALELRDQVLTARVVTYPDFLEMPAEELALRADQVIENDPELRSQEQITRRERRAIERRIQYEFDSALRSVPPAYGGQPQSMSYTFTGLDAARKQNATLTLRYRFYILENSEHETFDAIFRFNDEPNTDSPREYVPTMAHRLPLPPHYIREDGTLTITIANLYQPPPGDQRGHLNFDADGIELRYKAGTFETNYLRTVLITWIKLAFLAAVGVFLSTFLSFPVACLFAFTIFIAGVLGPFLAGSLEFYEPLPTHMVEWGNVGQIIRWAFMHVTRAIGLALVFLLKGFGEYQPTHDLVDGQLIRWISVLGGFAKLCIFWSGVSLIFGAIVLRYRQLAIYSGHG